MDEYDAVSAQCGELKKQEDALASEKDIDYEKLAEVRCELARLENKVQELAPVSYTHLDVYKRQEGASYQRP